MLLIKSMINQNVSCVHDTEFFKTTGMEEVFSFALTGNINIKFKWEQISCFQKYN